MGKILVIAAREYRAIVGTKAFLLSIILMPLLMGGGIAAQLLLHKRLGPEERKIAVVGCSQELFNRLAAAAMERNEREASQDGKPTGPRFVLIAGPFGKVTEEIRFELSQQARRHQIDSFVEIPEGIENTPADAKLPAVKFYAENAAVQDERGWLQGELSGIVRENRFREAKIDAKLVDKASAPVIVEPLELVERSKGGEFSKPRESSFEESFFLPFGMMMLMFMVILLGSQPMLESVIEEKSQRIAEVLLGSANAFQIMVGKLIGGVGGSLTVVATYAAGGLAVALCSDTLGVVPLRVVPWFIIYQVLAVMLFGSIFMAVGAAVNQLKEAQSMLLPIWLLVVIPFFVWPQVLRDPTGSFAMWFSFFPPATPLLMVLRMGSTSAIPLWQLCAGILILLAATGICIFAAARIFRIGILAQGKAPRLGEILRWAVRG